MITAQILTIHLGLIIVIGLFLFYRSKFFYSKKKSIISKLVICFFISKLYNIKNNNSDSKGKITLNSILLNFSYSI